MEQKQEKEICNYCLFEGDKLPKCVACKLIPYCSKECQQLDWKRHKDECGKTGKICGPSMTRVEVARARAQLQRWIAHKENIGAIALLANLKVPADQTFTHYLDVVTTHSKNDLVFYIPPGLATVKSLNDLRDRPEMYSFAFNHPSRVAGKGEEYPKTEIFLLFRCIFPTDMPAETLLTHCPAYPINAVHAEAMDYYAQYPDKLLVKFNLNQNMVDFAGNGGRKKKNQSGKVDDPFLNEFSKFLDRLATPIYKRKTKLLGLSKHREIKLVKYYV